MRILNCEHCASSFYKTEHLIRHERTHTGVKPFRCSFCGKMFARPDTLSRHKRSAHQAFSRPNPRTSVSSLATDENDSCGVNAAAEAIASPSTLRSVDALQDNVHSSLDGSLESNLPKQSRPNPTSMLHGFEHNYWVAEDEFAALTEFLWGGDFDALADMPIGTELNNGSASFQRNRVSMDSDNATLPPIQSIQKAWYTYLGDRLNEANRDDAITRNDGSRYEDTNNSPTFIDEELRVRINNSLRVNMASTESCPSTEYMNTCLCAYFEHFQSVCPIIHQSTFRVISENAFLVVAACSLGSLYLGTSKSRLQGKQMVARLHQVCMSTWDSVIVGKTGIAVALSQGAIIGQTYHLMSGDPMCMTLAEAFHGTAVVWARRVGIFGASNTVDLESLRGMDRIGLDKAWRNWARMEEFKRVALFLHVHDVERAALFFTPPTLRHFEKELLVPCYQSVYSASSAEAWLDALHQHPLSYLTVEQFFSNSSSIPSTAFAQDRFSLNILLVGIEARVFNMNYMDDDDRERATAKISHHLFRWREVHATVSLNESLPASLLIYWHAIFMSLFVSIDMITRAVGRSGMVEMKGAMNEAKVWRASASSVRAFLHTIRIWQLASTITISTEPALQLPRNLFHSALTIFVFQRCGDATIQTERWDELAIGESQASIESFEGLAKQIRPLKFVRAFHNMLRLLGHWGISQRLAKITELLLADEIDGMLR